MLLGRIAGGKFVCRERNPETASRLRDQDQRQRHCHTTKRPIWRPPVEVRKLVKCNCCPPSCNGTTRTAGFRCLSSSQAKSCCWSLVEKLSITFQADPTEPKNTQSSVPVGSDPVLAMDSKVSASTTGSRTSDSAKDVTVIANESGTSQAGSVGISRAAKSSGSRAKPAKKQRKSQSTRCKVEGCIKFMQSHNGGYCRQHFKESLKKEANADYDDEAFALALQRQERDQYRRRDAATKVERFEPGGNPNVLDYGASFSSSVAPSTEQKPKKPSSSRDEGVPKVPVPKAAAKSSEDDVHITDQEAADAALAAELAAMYEDPKYSSALEKVKFGGRKRGAVKMFQPGGNPRETNPTEDYNLPPQPQGEDVEPSAKRPKILSRKPGRVSKEEEARLMAAEEATQARLRDIMGGFGNTQEKAQGKSCAVIEEEESQQKIQIQMSFADLLSNPRNISIDRRPVKVSISCRPAVLDLTEEEAGEAERQLRALYATNGNSDDDIPSVGCMISLVCGSKRNNPDAESNKPRYEDGSEESEGNLAIGTPEEFSAIITKMLESYLIEDGEIEVPLVPTRTAAETGSLDVYTRGLMKHHSNFPVGSLVDVVGVMKSLHMEPRRGYDILDVLCHLNIVERVVSRKEHKSGSGVAKNAFIWIGASGLSLLLAQLQQEAFQTHDAKGSGLFERVEGKMQRMQKTNTEDCPLMPSLGKVALNLLMIVMVQQNGISISQASKRVNGSAANKRSKRRLNDAIKVLCGLDILRTADIEGRNGIKWFFHASLTELPGLLREWPSENHSDEGRVSFLTHGSSPADHLNRGNVCQGVVKDLPRMSTHLVLFQSDSEDVVVGARAKVSSSDENSMLVKMISDDLVFWEKQSLCSNGRPLDLAFLHRLMRPLALRTKLIGHEGGIRVDRGRIRIMPFSLLDVVLQCRILQPYFVDGILGRLLILLDQNAEDGQGFQTLLLEALHNVAYDNGSRAYIIPHFRQLVECFKGNIREGLIDEILSTFAETMDEAQLQEMFSASSGIGPLQPIGVIAVVPLDTLISTPHKVTGGHVGKRSTMEARSCWAKNRKTQLAVRAERLRLLRAFDESKRAGFASVRDDPDSPRRSSRQIIPRGRCKDGALIFSENEMTLEEFLERRTLMRMVNQSFTRSYTEGVSKPALSQLDLTANDVKELQSVFFDEDGSLRDEMKLEIDSGMKNDPRYIVFANLECDKERKDARWQVPIRHHGVGSEINSRKKVEHIMSKRNILITDAEELDDIGLLFGGIEDQSLHHDTARQLTSWMKYRPLADQDEMVELEAIPGWEVDRLEYNAAMASPAASGSLLVGLHGGDSVYLGVQKDQITRVDNFKCKIRNGKHDEILPIVRENDHLVVVEAKRGVMFTGDFPHAGVRNFSADSEEQRLMDMLKEKIAEIADRYPVHERVLRTKATVEMMANFPGLNKLCRLHCSTRMVKGGILVPDNSVGFDGCLPNEPDRRCFENDVAEEVEEAVEVKAPPKRRKLSEAPKQRIVSGSSSPHPKIVTPEREDEPRSYEGWRVAKFYRGKVNFGTVHEHEANGISALLRFDDGDFEMCRLSEVKNLIRLYSEHEKDDEQAIDKCEKRNRQARPADGEAISVAADTSGHLFWASVSKEDVLVRTKVAGKLICSGIATLPGPGKATGKRNSIFKVAKERDGVRYDGSVVEFDPKQERWEIQYPWGSEHWKLSDIEKGFAFYCSGFHGGTESGKLGLRRCAVIACDRHAQGPKRDHMCQAHYREYGGKLTK